MQTLSSVMETRIMRDARAAVHVGIAKPRSRGNRSRQSRRMRNPQFYVSDKRPIATHSAYTSINLFQ